MTPRHASVLLPPAFLYSARAGMVLVALASLLLVGCAGTGAAMKASPTLSHVAGIVNIPVADLEREYTNEESEFIKVNGYRIHYRDEGQGEPIVFLHDAYSSLQTWDGWVSKLASQYRIIRLDLPGFGLTGAPKKPESFDRASIDATFAEFIDRLELEDFTLVGNGLGGEIAADYAALNGNRINQLILLAPTGYPRELGWGINMHLPILLGVHLVDAYGDPDQLRKEDNNRYLRMGMRPGSGEMYTTTRKFIRARAEDPGERNYQRISTPTLLMWGGEDDLVPSEHAGLWAADVPNNAVVIYPEAGHMPMEELPEQTLADAVKFLSDGLAGFPEEEPEVEEKAEAEAAPAVSQSD